MVMPFLSFFSRYDHDSGHDSGSEDTCYELSQPFTLLTVGMGKLFIPKASHNAASGDHGSRVLPLPQRIGICLDYEAGRVFFYDADTMRCFFERQVDCSGIMYPAFGLMGGGAIHLEEFITAKRLTYMWNVSELVCWSLTILFHWLLSSLASHKSWSVSEPHVMWKTLDTVPFRRPTRPVFRF